MERKRHRESPDVLTSPSSAGAEVVAVRLDELKSPSSAATVVAAVGSARPLHTSVSEALASGRRVGRPLVRVADAIRATAHGVHTAHLRSASAACAQPREEATAEAYAQFQETLVTLNHGQYHVYGSGPRHQ